MLRGVNKRIIEITNTENDYFERAILVVRHDKRTQGAALLKEQADRYIETLDPQPVKRDYLDTVLWVAKLGAAAAFGAAVTSAFVLFM